jgi:hypothetical protein
MNDELRMCEFETHQSFSPPPVSLTSGERVSYTTHYQADSSMRHILKTPVHSYSESVFEIWASEKIALRKFSWLGKK